MPFLEVMTARYDNLRRGHALPPQRIAVLLIGRLPLSPDGNAAAIIWLLCPRDQEPV
jgi:hypothetical protein